MGSSGLPILSSIAKELAAQEDCRWQVYWCDNGNDKFVESEDKLAWVVAHEIVHKVPSDAQHAGLRAIPNALAGGTNGASGATSPGTYVWWEKCYRPYTRRPS